MPINWEKFNNKLGELTKEFYPEKTYEEKYFTDFNNGMRWAFQEWEKRDILTFEQVKEFIEGWIAENERRIETLKAQRK